MSSRGVLLFAHNNDVFPYHQLTVACAWFIRQHLGVPVVVVTDKATKSLIVTEPGADRLIDDYILVEHEETNGPRTYRTSDGDDSKSIKGVFRNKTRVDAYDLSPFDETLLMDSDYILLNNRLDQVWGSDAPIRINKRVESISFKEHSGYDRHVHPLGIPQYWSTVMYFRKSPEAKTFYDGMKYIKQNYEYLSRVYRFPSSLFRIDHAVSIMAHCMNGGLGENAIHENVRDLPDGHLLFAWDDQPLLKIEENRAWMVAHGTDDPRARTGALIDGQSVHMMNKAALLEVLIPFVHGELEK